jgi:hypothetical protein
MDNAANHPRRFFRFSLRALLLFVVAASLALAAMRYATSVWASGVVTVTVLMLLASVALAACSRGERRSYWVGFAICGGGYLLATTCLTSVFAPEFMVKLATSQSIVFLGEKFHPHSDYEQAEKAAAAANPYPYSGGYSSPPRRPLLPSQVLKDWNTFAEGGYEATAINFLLIGQCVWALIIAILGGTIARFAATRADPN